MEIHGSFLSFYYKAYYNTKEWIVKFFLQKGQIFNMHKMDNFYTFLLEKGYIKLTLENEWIIINV